MDGHHITLEIEYNGRGGTLVPRVEQGLLEMVDPETWAVVFSCRPIHHGVARVAAPDPRAARSFDRDIPPPEAAADLLRAMADGLESHAPRQFSADNWSK